jgi:photosynthetic reaction center H subunit
MSHAITSSIDTAQIVLYAFFIFFVGLIVWLRREDRREGYPLEHELRMVEGPRTGIPAPKEFLLPGDEGVRLAPDFVRDRREIAATRVAPSPGAPLEPSGDPLLSGVGPASFAERADHAELGHLDGRPVVVPMRIAEGYRVDGGPDPRGWRVIGADRVVAGTITDLWVDRADLVVRYLELELASAAARDEVAPASARAATSEASADADERPAGDESVGSDASPADAAGESAAPAREPASRRRLIPMAMLGIDPGKREIHVHALKAEQFAMVPATRDPEAITVREEERVGAFFAGGWFYAEPSRREAVL